MALLPKSSHLEYALIPQLAESALVARGISANNVYLGGYTFAPGNTAFTVGRLYADWFVCSRDGTLERVGIRLSANGGAGAKLRVGIYDADPTTHTPRNLLVDGGEQVADSGAPTFLQTTISIAVTAGQLIWRVYLSGTAAPTVSGITTATAATIMRNTSAGGLMGFSATQAYGALPGTFPTTGWQTETSLPDVLVRYT